MSFGLLAPTSRDSPTSVDFLHCVMVVADVFAQAVGGVKGLFTLPTWVPFQRLWGQQDARHQNPKTVLGASFFSEEADSGIHTQRLFGNSPQEMSCWDSYPTGDSNSGNRSLAPQWAPVNNARGPEDSSHFL